MRILVTGATGCLGRHVVSAVRAEGEHEIISVARRHSSDGIFFSVDLTDMQATTALVRDVRADLIFHCAGGTSGDLESDIRVNVSSSRWLMEAAQASSGATRVVLIGSAAEYGLVYAKDNPISEDRVLRPISSYGASKAMQTALSSYFAAARGVDVVVGRLFNLYAESMATGLFVGRVQAQIEELREGNRGAIEVWNLEAQRDYIDAAEAARQLLAIAKGGVAGSVYNVGSGAPTRMADLLQRMLAEAGMEGVPVRSNASGGEPGPNVPIIFADMRKTRALMSSCGDSE